MNNHKCVFMNRYNDDFIEISMKVWLTVCNVYHFKIGDIKNDEDLKLAFIHYPNYKKIDEFAKWAIGVGVINVFSYVQYLALNKVPINKWMNSYLYKTWLQQFLKDEPFANGVERSKQWLADNRVSLNSITPERLCLGIEFGHITYKYLESMGYNADKIHDIMDENQWERVRHLMITTDRNCNVIHNS